MWFNDKNFRFRSCRVKIQEKDSLPVRWTGSKKLIEMFFCIIAGDEDSAKCGKKLLTSRKPSPFIPCSHTPSVPMIVEKSSYSQALMTAVHNSIIRVIDNALQLSSWGWFGGLRCPEIQNKCWLYTGNLLPV